MVINFIMSNYSPIKITIQQSISKNKKNRRATYGTPFTNMTPWVGYENDYLLGLHTATFANFKNATSCCGGGGSSGVSLGIEWEHTVIHCKDSSHLVIKKRDQLGVLQKAKRTLLIVLFFILFLIGIISLSSLVQQQLV